ncbi:MAG: hypothetical protein A2Y10_17030 [Planctomycetes bacterium GWF2_41_51]|nr:MAG: hypothetical protein A2Y10_17030 [Planctomycetes bacterium GWF2_41_51]
MQIEQNVQTLAGRYKIQGNVRFLSHQEAMRAIQRSLIRSGVNLLYSQGYNPRPRLSLPLPKSVGLESEDELFCAQISNSENSNKEIYQKISAQLPEGFSLIDIAIHNGKVSIKPIEAEYVVQLSKEEIDSVSAAINKLNESIAAGVEIIIERTVDEKGNVKTVDVGRFIKSVEPIAEGVKIISLISDKGTIRPDEIIKLLGLGAERLGISMTRKKVNWQMN